LCDDSMEKKSISNKDESELKSSEAAQEACAEQSISLEVRIGELEEENRQLSEQLEQQKSEFVRKAADMDNYRKRLLREKEAAVQFANERLIMDLIPLIDDFERAIEAGQTSADIDSYAEGVKLIHKQFLDLLGKSWGLKPMNDIIGKEFSPHDHEAMMMEEGPQWETETVLAELQKGYYLHDRVLRTAKVKVGKPQ